jgi:hypothetical protein
MRPIFLKCCLAPTFALAVATAFWTEPHILQRLADRQVHRHAKLRLTRICAPAASGDSKAQMLAERPELFVGRDAPPGWTRVGYFQSSPCVASPWTGSRKEGSGTVRNPFRQQKISLDAGAGVGVQSQALRPDRVGQHSPVNLWCGRWHGNSGRSTVSDPWRFLRARLRK